MYMVEVWVTWTWLKGGEEEQMGWMRHRRMRDVFLCVITLALICFVVSYDQVHVDIYHTPLSGWPFTLLWECTMRDVVLVWVCVCTEWWEWTCSIHIPSIGKEQNGDKTTGVNKQEKKRDGDAKKREIHRWRSEGWVIREPRVKTEKKKKGEDWMEAKTWMQGRKTEGVCEDRNVSETEADFFFFFCCLDLLCLLCC